MLTIKYQTAFKKDYKRIVRRGYDVRLLEEVISILAEQKPLPEIYRDHNLSGCNQFDQFFRFHLLFFGNRQKFLCQDSLAGGVHLCGVVHVKSSFFGGGERKKNLHRVGTGQTHSVYRNDRMDMSFLFHASSIVFYVIAYVPYVGITQIRL